MKKLIFLILFIVIFTTSTSFCQPNPNTVGSLNDLNRIESDLGLVINNLMKCKKDLTGDIETLNFNRNLVMSILYKSYNSLSTSKNTEISNRETSSVIHITSLYSLTINGLSMYIKNPQLNERIMIDAIAEYKAANNALKELNEYVNSFK